MNDANKIQYFQLRKNIGIKADGTRFNINPKNDEVFLELHEKLIKPLTSIDTDKEIK